MNIPKGWKLFRSEAYGTLFRCKQNHPIFVPTTELIPEECPYCVLSAAPTPPEVEYRSLAPNSLEYRNPANVNDKAPEVEPVYQCRFMNHDDAAWFDVAPESFEENNVTEKRILYTSPPSPQAEYSSTSEPLNLRAAAEDAVKAIYVLCADEDGVCDTLRKELWAARTYLRKFLGESS